MVKPAGGSILFKEKEIVGRQPYEIARLGIGIVPEDRRIFPSLTVHENLLMGIVKRSENLSVGERWSAKKVYDLFPHLKERMKQKGGHLSGGEQQMLTMGRTLMGNPELILIAKGNDAKKVPHKKAAVGLSAEDAKAVADYVKTLK